MRPVFVEQAYTTRFGELWDWGLKDLLADVVSGLDCRQKFDAVFVGNMLAGTLGNQGHLGAIVAGLLGYSLPTFQLNSACASGGIAAYQAWQAVRSAQFERVLVVGVEKMTDYDPAEIAKALGQAGDFDLEGALGLTFPHLYGLVADAYLRKYGLSEAILDEVAVRAHQKGAKYVSGHFQNEISVSEVAASRLVADPLRLLHCSPITDGAAAVVLSAEPSAVELKKMITKTTADLAIARRKDLTSFEIVRDCVRDLAINVADLDLVEVHDCFAIAELIALEDLGLAKPGCGSMYRGKTKINVRGGLKAGGHPVGATGVKQLATLFQELAVGQQALAHNVGGVGSSVVLSYLTKS